MSEKDTDPTNDRFLDQPLLEYPHLPWRLRDILADLQARDRSASDPTLSEVDLQIQTICQRYASAPGEHRARLRQIATNGHSLLHFPHRMAIRAMRTRDVGTIRMGLLALSLEDLRNDFRDTLTCLAMLRHAALYLKTDYSARFKEVADLSSPQMAKFIQEFLARDSDLQGLEAFGQREGRDANGVTIERYLAESPGRRRQVQAGHAAGGSIIVTAAGTYYWNW